MVPSKGLLNQYGTYYTRRNRMVNEISVQVNVRTGSSEGEGSWRSRPFDQRKIGIEIVSREQIRCPMWNPKM